MSGAASLIDHFTGDFDTVVGMPSKTLAALLQAQGIGCHSVNYPVPPGIRII